MAATGPPSSFATPRVLAVAWPAGTRVYKIRGRFPPSKSDSLSPNTYHLLLEKFIRISWVRDLYDPTPLPDLVRNRITENPHPVFFIPAVGIGAGIVGATVLTPLLTVPVLGLVGFSAAGPVAGKETSLLTRMHHLINSCSSPPHFYVPGY